MVSKSTKNSAKTQCFVLILNEPKHFDEKTYVSCCLQMAEEEKAIEAVEDQDNVAALKETAKAKLLNGANSDSMSNGHDDPNGNGKSSEEVEEDDEVETIEGDDDEPMEADDDDSDDIIEEGRSPNGEAEEVETAEDEEEEEESEDDEIQEVKDDSSDSDVMEVEAEDPLKEVKVSSSVTSTEVKKPQVKKFQNSNLAIF